MYSVIMRRKGEIDDTSYILGIWTHLKDAKSNAEDEQNDTNELYKYQIFKMKLNSKSIDEVESTCNKLIISDKPMPIKKMRIMNL